MRRTKTRHWAATSACRPPKAGRTIANRLRQTLRLKSLICPTTQNSFDNLQCPSHQPAPIAVVEFDEVTIVVIRRDQVAFFHDAGQRAAVLAHALADFKAEFTERH